LDPPHRQDSVPSLTAISLIFLLPDECKKTFIKSGQRSFPDTGEAGLEMAKHSTEKGAGKGTNRARKGWPNRPFRGNWSICTQVRKMQVVPRVYSLTGF